MEPAILRQLAVGALVPGVFATVLFALAWIPRQPEAGQPRTALQTLGYWATLILVPLALPLVYLASHPIVFPMPETLRSSFDRLPIAAGILGVFTLSAVCVRAWALRAPLWILGLVLMALSIGVERAAWNDHTRFSAVSVGLFVLLGMIAIASTSALMRTTRGATSALLLLIIGAGASQLLVLGFHSLKHGQAAGFAASVAGGALAVSLLRPRRSLQGAGAAISAFTAFMMLHGVLFTETPYAWLLAALVTLSPAAALLVNLMPLTGIKATLARLMLAGLPFAIAMGIALSQKTSSAADY